MPLGSFCLLFFYPISIAKKYSHGVRRSLESSVAYSLIVKSFHKVSLLQR
nr:MAG TPA_asm: hypothetical protein [Caudoviricetes sp.]